MIGFERNVNRVLTMASAEEISGVIAFANLQMDFLFDTMNSATGPATKMIEDFQNGEMGDLTIYRSANRADVTDVYKKVKNALKKSMNRYNKSTTTEVHKLTGNVSIITSGDRVVFHYANNKRPLPF